MSELNDLQKRVYIMLHVELATYEGAQSYLLEATRNLLSGRKPLYLHLSQGEIAFSKEVNKIMQLTEISTEEMIEVLGNLIHLWEGLKNE